MPHPTCLLCPTPCSPPSGPASTTLHIAPHSALFTLAPNPRTPTQVNPLYLPQLAAVLSWPQSVGIVGGRPGASLYVCGVQEASFPSPPPSSSSLAPSPPSASPAPSPSFLYLDPHEAQAASRSALGSYFCDVVRVLPGASLDPSMAIGFVCSGPGGAGAAGSGVWNWPARHAWGACCKAWGSPTADEVRRRVKVVCCGRGEVGRLGCATEKGCGRQRWYRGEGPARCIWCGYVACTVRFSWACTYC